MIHLITITTIAFLIGLNYIDLKQTQLLLNISTDAESNPLIKTTFQKLGFIGVVIIKLMLTSCAIIVSLVLNSINILIILSLFYIIVVAYNHKLIINYLQQGEIEDDDSE